MGSNINAGNLASSISKDLNIIAVGNVNIVSGQDSSYKNSSSSKKGATVRKSSTDIDYKITNIESNVNAKGDVNIASGSNTNIIASNLTGTNGNIIVGKYIDQNTNSSTFGQEIINNDAKLIIKSGEDYHHNYHQDMKIKTDSTAVAVGVVAAVAVTVATGGTGAAVAGAIVSGAATGAQGKKGKTTTTETTEIKQVSSNLNFTGDLNTQSSGDTQIKASNLTADNAAILTGKFKDQTTNAETIVNLNSQLKIESAFDSKKTDTTTERVKPNYVGIAVVAGGSAYLGATAKSAANPVGKMGPQVPALTLMGRAIPGWIASGVGSSLVTETAGFIDPLFNIKNKSNYSNHKETEIKTNLNFNNLTTQ